MVTEVRTKRIDADTHFNLTVDYPLLKHMHRAGCRRIYYGWESGSQRMLDVLKKDLTPEVIINAAKMTRRAGIWAKVYLIVGSPGETAADIEETEKVLRLAGTSFRACRCTGRHCCHRSKRTCCPTGKGSVSSRSSLRRRSCHDPRCRTWWR